ncbi:MAG: pyrroline-5-carboxylate reductase [Prevotellaceae bacterium]|jgi:pyrroline-5-carboxylate reductase|nr:pyrroline-5-carboxylate reductase [Prevotellaceae bacterium]
MKITIIGAGNMGGAIARGLTKSSIFQAKDITVTDVAQENLDKIKAFNNDINVSLYSTREVNDAGIVLLAVKPWLVEDVIEGIKFNLDLKKQMIVSIAAGVSINQLLSWLRDNSAAVFRVMPNTAIEVGESMTAIASCNASKEQNDLILSVFNELGKAALVSEIQMDAYMALCSCGIANAFRYVRAATEGGVQMGIPAESAKNAVLQTLRGAIDLLEHTGGHPEAEIDRVTTPGGTTIRGLNAMEAYGFSSAVIQGLLAAKG